MAARLEFQIRDWLARYLSGDVALQAFHDAVAPLIWSVSERASASLCALAHEVEWRLAEYSNGDWTERELRSLLHPLVTDIQVTYEAAPAAVVTSTGSLTRLQTVRPVGTLSATVFAS